MKIKKVLAVFLTAALLVGMTVPAMAGEELSVQAGEEALVEEVIGESVSEASAPVDAEAEIVPEMPDVLIEEEGIADQMQEITAAEVISDAEIMAEETEEETEEAEEAEEEELLLEANENAPKVTINGVEYTQKASGSDGKGGTWSWDGSKNLVLNNVSLTSVTIDNCNAVITLNGNNTVIDDTAGGGLALGVFSIDKLNTEMTITGSGKLTTNGISCKVAAKIVDTQVDTGFIENGATQDFVIQNSEVNVNKDLLSYFKQSARINIAGGNLIIDNSNVTVDVNNADARLHGFQIQLKGCSITNKNEFTEVYYVEDMPYPQVIQRAEGSTAEKLVIRRDAEPVTTLQVRYQTHIQGIGWQDYVKNGEMSGTTGQSKRLEAIRIELANLPYSGGIEYRTHVQTYGWQNWVSNNAMAGTSGQSKRLEAIQIRLTGEMAKYYDVYYQTHIQTFGWSGWAKNGEMCGSAGYSKRLEGIRIQLVEKGGKAPGSSANCYYNAAGGSSGNSDEPTSKSSGALVGYNTHVQTYGWQNYAYDGGMAGTSGESKRLEGIHISLIDKPYSGDIVYRTHVQTIGWQSWMKNGQMSGTSGQSKRLEGIQIYLTGEMAKHYDVYYRVHAQTYGWLGWAKNGEMAGTSGLSKRLEGINIQLVPKGSKAPGSTARPNVVGGGGKLPDNPYKG